MNEINFTWELQYSSDVGLCLVCNSAPQMQLAVWNGGLAGFYGQVIMNEGETIDYSEGNPIVIISLLETKAREVMLRET